MPSGRQHRSYGAQFGCISPNSSLPSAAVFLEPNIATAGLGPFPKRWTFIWYSIICLLGVLSSYQRKCRKSLCSGSLWKEWNICSKSHMTAVVSLQKRNRTHNSLFMRAEPDNSSPFSDTPWNSVEELGWHLGRFWRASLVTICWFINFNVSISWLPVTSMKGLMW